MNTRKKPKLKTMDHWTRFFVSLKAGGEWSVAALAIISTILIVLTSGFVIPPEIFIPVIFLTSIIAQAIGTNSHWAKSFVKESEAQEKADAEQIVADAREAEKAADKATIAELNKIIHNLENFALRSQEIALETKEHVVSMHHDHEASKLHEMSQRRESHLAIETGSFSPHSPITPSTAPTPHHHIINVYTGHSPHDPNHAVRMDHAAQFIRALSVSNMDPATALSGFNPSSPPPLIHAPTAPLSREHSSSRVHTNNTGSDKQDKNNGSHHSHHHHHHNDHHQTQRNSQLHLQHPPKHSRHHSAHSVRGVEPSQNHNSRNSQMSPHGRGDHSPSRVVSQSRSQLQIPRGRVRTKDNERISPDNIHSRNNHSPSSTAAIIKASVNQQQSAPILNSAHHFNYNLSDKTIVDGDERNSNTSTSKLGDNARESSVSVSGNGHFGAETSRRGSINKSVQVGRPLKENDSDEIDSPNTDDNTNETSISMKRN